MQPQSIVNAKLRDALPRLLSSLPVGESRLKILPKFTSDVPPPPPTHTHRSVLLWSSFSLALFFFIFYYLLVAPLLTDSNAAAFTQLIQSSSYEWEWHILTVCEWTKKKTTTAVSLELGSPNYWRRTTAETVVSRWSHARPSFPGVIRVGLSSHFFFSDAALSYSSGNENWAPTTSRPSTTFKTLPVRETVRERCTEHIANTFILSSLFSL